MRAATGMSTGPSPGLGATSQTAGGPSPLGQTEPVACAWASASFGSSAAVNPRGICPIRGVEAVPPLQDQLGPVRHLVLPGSSNDRPRRSRAVVFFLVAGCPGRGDTRETRVKGPRLPKQTGASRAPWLGRHGEQLHLGAETGAVSRGGTGTSRRGPTGHPEATNRCSRVRAKRPVDASRRAGQGVPLLRMVPDGTGMQVVQIPAHHV